MSDNITDINTCRANLYEILDLHDDAVRDLPKAEQDAVIQNAYDRLSEQHRTLCSNVSHEDCDMAYVFQVAHRILKNREKRAEYNKLLDFNHGFWRRWKVIMQPDRNEHGANNLLPFRRLWESLPEGLIVVGQSVDKAEEIVRTSKDRGGVRRHAIMTFIQSILRIADLLLNFFSKLKDDFLKNGFMALTEDVGDLSGLPARSKAVDLERPSNNQIRITYVSVGPWVSRMVLSYRFLGSRMTVTASGSGESVTLPGDCTNIRVRFEIMRFPFVWCDLRRWNRFNEVWDETSEPHVFDYAEPKGDRTFKIGGSLYFEKVLKVTDNKCHDVDDM